MTAKKIFSLTVLAVFLAAGMAYGEMTGLDIIKKSKAVDDDGKTMKSTTIMELVDKNGKKRVRRLVRLLKKYPDGEKSLTTFLEPPDVKGTGFLVWSYDEIDKNDDQWLYLPALRKVRRISSTSKGDYFMGTEFTYDDMGGERKTEEDNHKLEGSETIDGKDCYKVISTAKDEDYMYSKRVQWIDKESFLEMKVDFYDEDEELLKIMTRKDIKKIDNIWTGMWLEMKNVQKNRATIVKFGGVQYNLPIKDSMFTQRMVKKGIKE